MNTPIVGTESSAERARLIALDLARTAALAGMVVYHFTYDLQLFGYIPWGTATTGGWALFARLVAGSFLFLAGVSLVLAHGTAIHWRPFWRRAAMVGAGAALISLVTWYNMPQTYVFFGILHSILACSVIGLAFLRLPSWATALAAATVFLARDLLRAPPFDADWLLWLGLSTGPVDSVDYVPVFPWLAPFLIGMALAQTGVLARLQIAAPAVGLRRLAWPGRHSLAIYLVHQPLLIGGLWAVTQMIR